jgi:Cu+-exporting ATPase
LVAGTCIQSNHPLSKAIYDHLNIKTTIAANYFEEFVGKGVEAHFGEDRVKLGSPQFILHSEPQELSTVVLLEINGQYQGAFKFEQPFRMGMEEVIKGVAQNYKVTILSGDNEKDKKRLLQIFGKSINFEFNKTPIEKLQYITALQAKGEKVMMVGDGLNDAGALKQSDAGIVLADDGNNFTPACEGVLAAPEFKSFLQYLTYLTKARYLIYGALLLAIAYNFTGLFFAVSGKLSPVVAAVLMPLSSITVIAYGLISSKLASFKHIT